MAELHRHYTDSLAFAPRQPSRLGPGRGTMSLPTSPRLGAREVVPQWAQQPQSARVLLDGVAEGNAHRPLGEPWFGTSTYSPSDAMQLQLDDAWSHAHGGSALPSSGPIRKKRAQVRIACTHCQKACKKCSNTRPCERCVKYGLKDCIDSTRKPRKTGVKRGPYKRRTSGKFDPFFIAAPGSHHSLPNPVQMDSSSGLPFPSAPNSASRPNVNGYRSPPDPVDPFGQVQQQLSQASSDIFPSPAQSTPLKTAALHGAFASALSGPRWVHGQRTGGTPSGEVLYPPTPHMPFPVSLHHRDDPFSRAVSPIHGDLDSEMQGLKPKLADGTVFSLAPFGPTTTDPPDAPMSGIEFQNPFDPPSSAVSQAHVYSAPVSPGLAHSDVDPMFRAASDEPATVGFAMPRQLTISPTQTPFGTDGPAPQQPAIIALKKIRKPSLRTLMSHGGSLAPSRQTSPVRESPLSTIHSPTLFDQPMMLDEGLEVELPESGWTGYDPAPRDEKMDDGLSLLGLGLGPFQT